jgi:hypothetical protein
MTSAEFAQGIEQLKANAAKLPYKNLVGHTNAMCSHDTPAEFDDYVAYLKQLVADRAPKPAPVATTAPRKTGNCYKCDGSGYINAFRHRDAGACYACGGTGNRTRTPTAPR